MHIFKFYSLAVFYGISFFSYKERKRFQKCENSKVKWYYLEKAVNFLKQLLVFRSDFCKHAWMLTVTKKPWSLQPAA